MVQQKRRAVAFSMAALLAAPAVPGLSVQVPGLSAQPDALLPTYYVYVAAESDDAVHVVRYAAVDVGKQAGGIAFWKTEN